MIPPRIIAARDEVVLHVAQFRLARPLEIREAALKFVHVVTDRIRWRAGFARGLVHRR
jgi:hypothetical protein